MQVTAVCRCLSVVITSIIMILLIPFMLIACFVSPPPPPANSSTDTSLSLSALLAGILHCQLFYGLSMLLPCQRERPFSTAEASPLLAVGGGGHNGPDRDHHRHPMVPATCCVRGTHRVLGQGTLVLLPPVQSAASDCRGSGEPDNGGKSPRTIAPTTMQAISCSRTHCVSPRLTHCVSLRRLPQL